MYPFKTDRIYPRNRWYVAAFAHEVGRDPFERTICDIPVVFYRTEAGDAVAMYGICPHRYFPLAPGKLAGDNIVCGYHGFTFAASGKCVRIPSQETGAGFEQPIYPLIEKGSLIWIWMGDKEKADPALLPPYEDVGLEQPGWSTCGLSLLHLKGRSQLLIDNLMDLTHVGYIHGALDGGEAMVNTQLKLTRRNCSHRLDRYTRMRWSGFHDLLFKPENRFEGLSEINALTDFYGPEMIRTSGPITSSIEGLDAVPPEIGEVYFLHFVTPETQTSTHYFGATTRNFRIGDERLDVTLSDLDKAVRLEDVVAIDAVESRLEESVSRQRELLARSDAPAIKVRELIQQMIDAEVS